MPVTKRDVGLRHKEQVSPVKPATHGLSKSRFCTGVQCVKALYLKVHQPDLGAEIDAGQQMIFDQGTQVGVEARKRYAGGELIEWDHFHSKEALEATQKAILRDPPAIFEAAFVFHSTLVRIDVLKNNGDGSWDVIEVKSTTDLKDEHIPDIAIQRYVAESAGLKVARTLLKHLNRQCVFPNLDDLFVDVDCTRQVLDEMKTVPDRITQMLAILSEETPPDTEIGPHCDSPYECSFKTECWKEIPEHSVFELNAVWDKTKFELFKRGVVLIKDIPEGEKVSRAKPQQVLAVQTGEPVIDRKGLNEFLSKFEYPVFFLDFESLNSAIPRYRGLKPYSQLTFQFSCHVAEGPGAELKHFEHLADGSEDPRPALAQKLVEALGTRGTIVSYNQSFEKTRIEELARHLPSLANELRNLLNRFIDLKDAFSKFYYHPDFHGSFSIKDVLPVLVPSMSYEGLEVSNGSVAQAAYLKICDLDTQAEERNTLRQHLIAYCSQDTMAMVKLLAELKRIAELHS